MKFCGFVFALVCVFSLGGCGHASDTRTYQSPTGTPAATPDEFSAVRAVYAKDCQNCHGVDGTGGRVKLEDGKTLRVPSLREGHALRHTDSDFRTQIIEGGDGMPSFKVQLGGQVDEMVRFIRHEFQPGHTPPAEKK